MAFIIDDKEVDFKDISTLKQLRLASPYLIEVVDFLEKWYDSNESIEVYTSGSTGSPKQIKLTKNAMRASATKTAHFFSFKAKDTSLLGMSAKYIAGKMMIVRAIVSDLTLYLVKPSSKPLEGVNVLIDFLPMTPHQLLESWNNNVESINKVQNILLGGGPIHHEHEKIVFQLSAKVYHGFGMTETITHIAIKSLSNPDQPYVPLDGIKLSVGAKGQMVIQGDHLAETVVTNDLIEINADQTFMWLGRLDNVINSGGVKLLPELIESKLKPFMEDVAFFIHKEEDVMLGEKVVLLIESTGNSELSALDQTIVSVLDKYERPKKIYVIPSFVLTETGKINRKATFENK